jgi:glutathione synthase/RimK-type ligase-like ATP-grasp enzyme
MKNAERLILASVRRYAARHKLTVAVHGDGWIAEIKLGARSHLVHGYDLGLNSASSQRVANDKAATFEILDASGIPAVPHRLFMHPRFLTFMSIDGNWRAMREAFEAAGGDAVLKDNEGTGGMELARVRSVAELELASQRLFNTSRALALSPFLEIASETRVVLLDGACLLVYRKERPSVTGDGRKTLLTLVSEAVAGARLSPAALDLAGLDALSIPPAGRVIPVEWRHNLGQGAKAVVIDPKTPEAAPIVQLASRAFDRLGLRFASIDIVEVAGRHLVLEANSGVMLEVMARASTNGEALADQIYHRALDLAVRHRG